MSWKYHVARSTSSRYDMILVRYLLTSLVLDLKFSENIIMGADNPLNGPSPPMMMFSENLRYNTKEVSKYLPRIISYLLLVDLATWYFHDTILVALNYGRQKSTFTFFEVVNFPAWVSHVFYVGCFGLRFYVILPIIIVELIPRSNRIQKFLNNALPLRVFIQPYSIGE